ncbi:recombinase family protein [Deinococcus oregonensis]|uniref:Recombinase family protein n=1 Tax=Deinococcus oregonensis TaxID=1805970 RepID=A0ABV6AV07_9DEIO
MLDTSRPAIGCTRIYLRVSTNSQATEGFSLAAQRERALAWCTAEGISDSEIYTDAGLSGTRNDRPGLNALLSDLRRDDLVVVYALSRLGRGGIIQTLGIVKEIEAKGGRLVSLTEHIDTGTIPGRLVLNMLASISEMEVEITRERTHAGRQQAASQGVFPHAAKGLPMGYTRGEGGRIVTDDRADVVRLVFQLAAGGKSFLHVADELNKRGVLTVQGGPWVDTQVGRVIRNEVYHTGSYQYRARTHPDEPARWQPIPVPPLLSEAEWQAAQRTRTHNHAHRDEARFPLTGHLRCLCGARLHGRSNTAQDRLRNRAEPRLWYLCSPKGRGTPTCPANGKGAHYWRAEVVEASARASLEWVLRHPEALQRLAQSGTQQTDPGAAERAELEAQRGRLIELHLEGLIDRAEFISRRDALSVRIQALKPRPLPVQNLPELSAYADAVPLLSPADYVGLLRDFAVEFAGQEDGTVAVVRLSVPHFLGSEDGQ